MERRNTFERKLVAALFALFVLTPGPIDAAVFLGQANLVVDTVENGVSQVCKLHSARTGEVASAVPGACSGAFDYEGASRYMMVWAACFGQEAERRGCEASASIVCPENSAGIRFRQFHLVRERGGARFRLYTAAHVLDEMRRTDYSVCTFRLGNGATLSGALLAAPVRDESDRAWFEVRDPAALSNEVRAAALGRLDENATTLPVSARRYACAYGRILTNPHDTIFRCVDYQAAFPAGDLNSHCVPTSQGFSGGPIVVTDASGARAYAVGIHRGGPLGTERDSDPNAAGFLHYRNGAFQPCSIETSNYAAPYPP